MFHAGKEIIIFCNDTQFHYFLTLILFLYMFSFAGDAL
uniref:Uncharacterized protein n=1 Tax=Klebsiella pneumoniae TaxID=573 RepID=A0A8E6NYR4_KLEPN|nr:hypothetical protein [Klebsiella pneumoniae]